MNTPWEWRRVLVGVKELGVYAGYTVAYFTAIINCAVVTADAANLVEITKNDRLGGCYNSTFFRC